MSVSTIHFEQKFPVPAEKVFNFFSDHERLGEIWDGRFKRIKDSHNPENVNGEGSVRSIQLPLIYFEETVTKFVPGKLIEYQITKGSPIKNHLGTMKFIDNGDGTSFMDYKISLESKIPFTTTLIQTILQVSLGKGIRSLAKRFVRNPDY